LSQYHNQFGSQLEFQNNLIFHDLDEHFAHELRFSILQLVLQKELFLPYFCVLQTIRKTGFLIILSYFLDYHISDDDWSLQMHQAYYEESFTAPV